MLTLLSLWTHWGGGEGGERRWEQRGRGRRQERGGRQEGKEERKGMSSQCRHCGEYYNRNVFSFTRMLIVTVCLHASAGIFITLPLPLFHSPTLSLQLLACRQMPENTNNALRL